MLLDPIDCEMDCVSDMSQEATYAVCDLHEKCRDRQKGVVVCQATARQVQEDNYHNLAPAF